MEPPGIFYCPTTPQFINVVLPFAMFAPSSKNILAPMRVCVSVQCIHMCMMGCAPLEPFFSPTPPHTRALS